MSIEKAHNVLSRIRAHLIDGRPIEHDYTSCSDDDPSNADRGCLRCIIIDGQWAELVQPDVAEPKCTMKELMEHVSKLNEMLKDPHFGLASWCMVYAEHMKAISNYWKGN